MNDLKETPCSSDRTVSKGSVDGSSSQKGWDAAILVILGAGIALAGLAWFLFGFLN